MKDNHVGRFFDTLTDDYTATIERCFPRYREMLWALLNYLPQGRSFESILELGCGTGNLSVLLHERYPEAEIRLVDVSGQSLEVCRRRFTAAETVQFEEQDFRKLTYSNGQFDLIISSISIHHLVSSEKQRLFQQCYGWITRDGIFAFADQCAGATDDLHACHIANWRKLSLDAGALNDEWEMWMQHQAEHDHHDLLGDQMGWLEQAGFSVVDCPWRFLLWSVLQARCG